MTRPLVLLAKVSWAINARSARRKQCLQVTRSSVDCTAFTLEKVSGQLTKQGASLAPSSNGVYVVLVRHVDANWTKVGELERE